MSDPTLEAVATPANEPSQPAGEANQKVEQGGHDAAPKDADKGDANGEPAKEQPKLSEAEKIRISMQKRIDRQTAATKAQQERIRQLEEQVQKASANQPKVDDEPKEENFNTWEEYDNARVEYRAKKEAEGILKAEREKELSAARERQAMEVRRQFAEKEKTFRTATPDYDRFSGEAVEAMNALASTGANIAVLRDAVMQFDNPPEMIYQLGKDTALIEELVAMEPLRVMRELVKLEIALKGSKAAEPEKAPTPIKGVSGRGGTTPISKRSGADILAWAKGK